MEASGYAFWNEKKSSTDFFFLISSTDKYSLTLVTFFFFSFAEENIQFAFEQHWNEIIRWKARPEDTDPKYE